jgi:replicative DNA helicase
VKIDYANVEDELLGSLINYPEQIADVVDIIGERQVFKRKKIWETVFGLWDAGETVSLVSVAAKLETPDVYDLPVGEYRGADSLARILVEKQVKSELQDVGRLIVNKAKTSDPFELLEEAQGTLSRMEYGITRKNFSSAREATREAMEAINTGFQGVPTGFLDLDRTLGGWRNSSLITLAGRPSSGKTALCICSALEVTEGGIPVAIFSHEMSKGEIFLRMIGRKARVNTFRLSLGIDRGRINDQELKAIREAEKLVASLPIHIDDTFPSASQTRSRARKIVREKGIKLIIIDYLQLVPGLKDKNGNREQEVSSISRTFKAMAKEFGLPVLCLSQLNRTVESRTDRRARLSDLRESGSIEQDSDIVVFINGDNDSNERLIDIAKHRNGPTGECKMTFLRDYASFENYSGAG